MLNSRFLIDTNVFINSKNFYYNFGYCKIFWDLLLELHKKNIVYSINSVKNEINSGNDEIVDWINDEVPNTFFSPEFSSPAWGVNYSTLMNWANSKICGFTDKAKMDFADQTKADAFLIAEAMTSGNSIITFESFDPNNPKKRVLIPNAARAHGVRTLTLYEFLPLFAHNNFTCK
ncbi:MULTISPECIES: DUF4411 family protein [Providencia]|uniref:DUF4411 family protein n=1 Tax=Providencia TaxID=586 RepID=UPI00234B0C80|nr:MULTISPECIES: DUF4411 family protein [unclassified Providencia]